MVYETIKAALVQQLAIEPDSISPDSLIEKDLEMDSTETVILALEIKKKFKVDFKFPENDMTLADLCKQVEAMLKTTPETVTN